MRKTLPSLNLSHCQNYVIRFSEAFVDISKGEVLKSRYVGAKIDTFLLPTLVVFHFGEKEERIQKYCRRGCVSTGCIFNRLCFKLSF